MKFSRLIKSKKAISPIFASLILIAIAVIAGIVVYMFTSGTIASMTGGGTAGQEKVAVQGVDVINELVYAQNTGGALVTITNATVKDAAGNIISQSAVSPSVDLDIDGVLEAVPVDLSICVSGQSYTVTLVSNNGGSFVSASFRP